MSLDHLLTRREFFEKLFTATVVASAAPSIVLGRAMPALSIRNNELVGTYKLSLSAYPALQQTYKSVRIKIAGMPASFGKILVTRVENNVFYAVSEQCTHEGYTINDLSASTHTYNCALHGSRFTPDGSVSNGPAARPLTKFTTSYDGADTVSIEIPGLTSAVPNELHAVSFLVHETPRPGDNVATVSFGVESGADVLLVIYAADGHEVMRLADGYRDAGTYRIPYDISSLPSGMYFYRLETSTGQIRTEKFIIAR